MPLTATVMAKLAEEGRIDLDSPIQRYLPEVGDSTFPVTVRSLAANLAGVRDFAEGEEIPGPCSGAGGAAPISAARSCVRLALLTVSAYGYVMLGRAGVRHRTALRRPPERDDLRTHRNDVHLIDDPRRYLPGRSQFYERLPGAPCAARTVDTSCRPERGPGLGDGGLVRFCSAPCAAVGFVKRETLEAMFTSQKTRGGARPATAWAGTSTPTPAAATTSGMTGAAWADGRRSWSCRTRAWSRSCSPTSKASG
jgi:hypothetical protein